LFSRVLEYSTWYVEQVSGFDKMYLYSTTLLMLKSDGPEFPLFQVGILTQWASFTENLRVSWAELCSVRRKNLNDCTFITHHFLEVSRTSTSQEILYVRKESNLMYYCTLKLKETTKCQMTEINKCFRHVSRKIEWDIGLVGFV
jgi:hypothetical protein